MAQVETKVQASTAAAAVSGLALWALGAYVFKGDVPDVVTSWTYALVPALLTLAAGYLAPHTHRPLYGPVVGEPRGGYRGGARAQDVGPPPDVPSGSVTPPEKTLRPPGKGT